MPRVTELFDAPRQEMGYDDILPDLLLDHIIGLSTDEVPDPSLGAPASGKPSMKRRKVNNSLPVSPICVSKGDICFSRRCSREETVPYAAIHRDVRSHISIDRGHVNMRFRSSAQSAAIWAAFSLKPEDIPQQAAAILWRWNRFKPKPGSIWATAHLSLDIQGNMANFKISLSLLWAETASPYQPLRSSVERLWSQKLIDTFYPRPSTGLDTTSWSPMDFYEAAFVPDKKDDTPLSIEIPGLEATLYPYQKRTLQWLLGREGKRWSPLHKKVESLSETATPSADSFRLVKDADGRDIYLSDVFHTITTDIAPYRQPDLAVKGGILAEEMGLGKTLEIIGLILLHGRAGQSHPAHINLVSSGATLIVTPESLREQWISEISRHAPALRVKHYKGCKKLSEEEYDKSVVELADCDVVITTYSVLTAELHFANDPPERSRRYERAYRRMKSPLVQISWWRLCLDEAQMIENGYSQAAEVARVLPRVNAWGITGTPVKDSIKDLYGLLLFLRYEPYCTSSFLWLALSKGPKQPFQKLFGTIALRHTKALVRDELSLPPQKRYVISMPFTAIEEQHYQSLFDDMTEECEVDASGAPVIGDWRPEDHEDKMRIWLNRLRQTVLHPEVGVYGRRVLGNKAGPMRTVEEVLDAMLVQSETTIRTEQRAYLLSRLTRGQLYENSPRVREALAIWEEVKKETAALVSDARVKLRDVIREQGDDIKVDGSQSDADNRSEPDEDSDEAEDKGQVGECRRRLRTSLDLHHRATFFCANAYFQIRDNIELTEAGSPEFDRLKKLEDEGYEEAKLIRREILQGRNRRAGRLMTNISNKASDQSFTEVPELIHDPKKGIESARIVEELEQLYAELNEQANVLDEWRERVIQLLLRPLVDEEDDVETTGEELGDSAKYQDELMVYVQALRACIADRQDAISGQTNELVKHETDTSIGMAKNGEGPAPEKLIELLLIRAEIRPGVEFSMRKAISQFRQLQAKLLPDSNRESIEHKISSDQLKATQAALNEQNKAALALESEVETFTAAMNARLEYYRQLQVVSDGVLPYEGPRTDAAIERMKKGEDESRRKWSSAEAKHRYLQHLKEAGSKSDEPRMCVICQMPFMTGVLTVCGHQFCKECMTMWFKAHHNCPVCKRALKSSNIHDITLKAQQLQVHSEGPSRNTQDQQQSPQQGRDGVSRKTHIYSEFNADKLAEITSIELDGPSFTTKVDTLVRHLLWLRESDPGAKSIVFSQYKYFLKVLRRAFQRFRIGFASIDEPNGITKFKNDPATECFLLHARAHSSGLNLVNASHVFLCEPLLNTALELQAIARVDRIGQQHETTVWLYYVSGTVEESIHNLSVRRRMEHMGRHLKGKSKESTPELLDANIEAANTLELESAALSKLMSKDKTAGEMVDKGDLWECLFGHVANREPQPERDNRFQEQAVRNYLAGEAAEGRKQDA